MELEGGNVANVDSLELLDIMFHSLSLRSLWLFSWPSKSMSWELSPGCKCGFLSVCRLVWVIRKLSLIAKPSTPVVQNEQIEASDVIQV